MKKILVVVALSFSLALSVPAVGQQLFDSETLQSLTDQVDGLRSKLGSATETIAANRVVVAELENQAESAPEVTQQLIDDLQTLIDAFGTGSDYFGAIQSAKKNIGKNIDRFRASESVIQQEAAASLQKTLADFDAIDDRRDQLLVRAIEAKRQLELQKDDIEALIIVEAYKKLAEVFTKMLDEVEGAVEEAEGVNSSLATASGLDSE